MMRVMDRRVHQAALESAGEKLLELERRSGETCGMNDQRDQQSENGKPPFDAIFPRFVNKDSPGQKLLGFIAYGLYQDAKREWISEFRGRENRYPLAEELRAHEQSWTASRLEALENAAAQLLTTYTDVVVTQAENQLLRGALKGSYWRAVWRWAGGALVYTLLLVALAVGLARCGIDLMTVVDTIIHPR